MAIEVMLPVTFFFRMNIQFENLGDILINRELIKIVGRCGRVIIDEAHCPQHVKILLRALDLPEVQFITGDKAFVRALLRERLQGRRCYFFMCPGGIGGELESGEYVKQMTQLPALAALRMIGLRMVQVGASYDGLGPRYIRFLRYRSSLLHAHCVRDERSAAYLRTSGIRFDGVIPDLAFNIFERPPRTSGRIKTVCLSFRTDQSPMQLDRIKSFLERLLALLPEGIQIRLMTQVCKDVAGMRALQEWLEVRKQRRVESHTNFEDIERNLEFLGNCDVVFSNRLHVLLLGGSVCGRMVACIDEYQPKIDGLFRTLKLGSSILPLEVAINDTALRDAMQIVFDGTGERERLRTYLYRLISM